MIFKPVILTVLLALDGIEIDINLHLIREIHFTGFECY